MRLKSKRSESQGGGERVVVNVLDGFSVLAGLNSSSEWTLHSEDRST
jgi:hypothetical protein